MPQPSKKRPTRIRTKHDVQRQREDVKLLVFAGGHGVREAARIVGVNEDTACKWSAEGQWGEQIKRIKDLVSSGEASVSTAEKVAFDLAKTNKESRAALAQIANLSVTRKLKKLAESDDAPGIVIEDASDFAAITKATAQIAGDWDSTTDGQKFAVSINIGEMVRDGRIRPLTEEECRDLEAQGYKI